MSEVNVSGVPQEVSGQEARESRNGRPLRVALFGFGTVASSVARILVESQPQGLELTHVYSRSLARRRVDWVPSNVIWSDDADAVLASDVDVVVELAGGLEPAGGWVRRALDAGKSVVTANKKLIAFQGAELERLAAAKGGHLKYGAAVAGGIPVIPGLEQGLAGDRIESIEGILNGTCNFILSKMEEGAEYAPVLAEAQAMGYAEADPTEDVGGFDARAKLAILMRLALRVQVDPEEIVPQPITSVTAVDFSYARDLGCTIRQVARAEQAEGNIAATVGPTLVAPYAYVKKSSASPNLANVTNLTARQAQFLEANAGLFPSAALGGSSTSDTVYFVGRNLESAVRTEIDANINFSGTISSFTTNSSGQAVQDPNLSDPGQNSGTAVKALLNVLTNTIATLAASDIGSFTPLAYEGVPYSIANVENGSYPLWFYENYYYQTSGATAPSANQLVIINALIGAITNSSYQATSPLFINNYAPLSGMQWYRNQTSDGGKILSNNY